METRVYSGSHKPRDSDCVAVAEEQRVSQMSPARAGKDSGSVYGITLYGSMCRYATVYAHRLPKNQVFRKTFPSCPMLTGFILNCCRLRTLLTADAPVSSVARKHYS